MRETFTGLFCVLAVFALVFGKASKPPDLGAALTLYQSALDRGDAREAARYGELTLAAAQKSNLFDAAGRARLAAMVASSQAEAGNADRAKALYQQAIVGLADGAHGADIAAAKAKLEALERIIAAQSLRGPMAGAAHAGG